MLGSRPKIFKMREYSSAVRPCSAATAAVTLASVAIKPDPSGRGGSSDPPAFRPCFEIAGIALSRHRNALHEAFYHGTENNQTIGGPKRSFHRAFRMRHQSHHIALAIAETGNIRERTIRISGSIIAAIRRGVTENNLIVPLQISKRGLIAEITAPDMRDGHFQNLPARSREGKRRAHALHAHMHLLAKKSQSGIPNQRPGQKTSFAKNLKSIANAENQSAPTRKFLHRFHNRGKTRQRPSAQIIAISKSARKDDRVAAAKILGAVPEKFYRLMQHAADRIVRIVIAIRPRKHNHAKFHSGESPAEILTQTAGFV